MTALIATKPHGFEVCVDSADAEYLGQFQWCVYSRNGYHYAVAQVNKKRTYMHRLLAGKPGLVVDHINGDTLDNRRANLRAVTSSENAKNSHGHCRSKTGFKGVHQDKAGKFIAHGHRANEARKYLGYFDTAEDANAAVQAHESGQDERRYLIGLIRELRAENARMAACIAQWGDEPQQTFRRVAA